MQEPKGTQTSPAAITGDRFFTKPIAIIFVTAMIDLIGFGIVIPVLPYYVEGDAFGASPFQLGLIVASYSTMQFIFSPIFGTISDRYGRRPVLFFSILGTALGFYIVGAATTLWMIFAGRILDGITGGNISTAQAYIADVTTRENRAKGMGLIGASFGIGFVVGPMLGGILSIYGHAVPFYFAAGMALLNAIALYFFLPESLDRSKVQHTARRKNRLAEIFDSLKDVSFRGITIIYFLIIIAFSIMTTSFTLYTMNRFNYTAAQNGYLFCYIGVIAVIMQGGLFNRLARSLGESKLILIGTALMAISLIAVPFVGPQQGGLTALLIGTAFFAIGNSVSSPALMSLASKNAHDHEQGKAMGVMQSGASLARAIGPVIAGYLMNNALRAVDDWTIQRTYWTGAAIMLSACFAVIYYLLRRNSPVRI